MKNDHLGIRQKPRRTTPPLPGMEPGPDKHDRWRDATWEERAEALIGLDEWAEMFVISNPALHKRLSERGPDPAKAKFPGLLKQQQT